MRTKLAAGLVGSVALASCQASRIGVIELSEPDGGAVADAEPAGDDATGPFVVDDFEDLDLEPYDARFAPWQDYSFNQPVSLASWMDIGAALNSNGGLNLEWAAQDPTYASLGECLSRVDSFNFQATSQIGDG